MNAPIGRLTARDQAKRRVQPRRLCVFLFAIRPWPRRQWQAACPLKYESQPQLATLIEAHQLRPSGRRRRCPATFTVAIYTVVLARYPHRVGTDSPRDDSGCSWLRGGDRRGHLWQLERSSQSVRAGWSSRSFIRHNPKPPCAAKPPHSHDISRPPGPQSGLCANLLQKHRTWRADPHAGSQSLICARCLVGKSATRRGLGMGVRCRYMASSDALQRLIQEYLQVP